MTWEFWFYTFNLMLFHLTKRLSEHHSLKKADATINSTRIGFKMPFPANLRSNSTIPDIASPIMLTPTVRAIVCLDTEGSKFFPENTRTEKPNISIVARLAKKYRRVCFNTDILT
jgi:hypothetical protein